MEPLEEAVARLHGQAEVSKGMRESLAPLEAYDAERGTNLVQTLYVYVQQGGNVAATAETLFLHRNSVLYRLQRIEEVGGIQIRDAKVRGLLFTAFALADPRFLDHLDAATGRNSHEDKREK